MQRQSTSVWMVLVLAMVGLIPAPAASAAPEVTTGLGEVLIAPSSGLPDGGTSVRVRVPALAWSAMDQGPRHTLAVAGDGAVYAWGDNDAGQLGTADPSDSATPAPVALPADVRFTAVAAGADFSLALATDGTVWSWGANGRGQLGRGPAATSAPAPVPGLTGVRVLEAGDQFAVVAVGFEGGVWSWGANDAGQLGTGSLVDSAAPTRLAGFEFFGPFDRLVVGSRHVLAFFAPYYALGWGDNTYGQLGDLEGPRATTPQPALSGTPRGAYNGVFAAGDATFAINTENETFAFGRNDQGQLGLGTVGPSGGPARLTFPEGDLVITAMSGSGSHVVALMGNGSVWTWGDNRAGQLGRPAGTRSTVPGVAARDTAATTVTGSELGGGFLAGDGTAQAWGANGSGQVGDGTTTARPTPVPVRYPLEPGPVLFGDAPSPSTVRSAPDELTATAPPHAAGPVDLTVSTTTADGASGPSALVPTGFRYTTTPAPEPVTTAVPVVVAGVPYRFALEARSATPVTWTLSEGRLPDGITLDPATGVLSGTAVAAPSYDPGAAGGRVALAATNTDGSTSLRTTVRSVAPPTLAGTTLPPAAAGRGYRATIDVAEGREDLTLDVTGGSLPDGVVVRGVRGGSSTGRSVELSGTPTTPGTSTFTLTATVDGGVSDSRTYTLVVGVPPVLSGTPVPSGTIGVPYAHQLTAAGPAPVTYAVAAGALPPGITLDPATGLLSGTPTATGRFDVVLAAAGAVGQEGVDVVLRIAGPRLSSPTTPSSGPAAGGTRTTVSTPSPRFVEVTTASEGERSLSPRGTVALTADGYVWGWGEALTPYRAERGRDVDPLVPARLGIVLPAGLKVAHLAEGVLDTVVATDGSVWQVVADPAAPTGVHSSRVEITLPAGVRVTSVVAGRGHRLALGSDGSVWAWGANEQHQLGDGTTTPREQPVRVAFPDGTRVTDLGASGASSLAVDSAGGLWSWGVDARQVGCPVEPPCPPLVHATPAPLDAPADLTATEVVAGPISALAIARDGSLWSWGDNAYRQLGHDATDGSFGRVPLAAGPDVRVVDAATSRENAVAVLSDGSVHRWGRLACPSGIGVVDCGAFDDNGDPFEAPTQVPPPAAPDAVAVTAGTQYALALTTAGTLWGWGANSSGQLGDGTTSRREAPVTAVAPFTVTGVTFDGTRATPVGPAGNGSFTVLTPAHARGSVDVVVHTTRPNGTPGPELRFDDAFTYDAPPRITSGPPPEALTRLGYSYRVTVEGPGPLTYVVTDGALPAGLTLDAVTGRLAGRPTTPGTSSFTVTVTGPSGTASAAWTMAVSRGTTPAITSGAPAAATVGSAYRYALTATGTAPLTYTVTSGTLPDGLNLNRSTGVVSGVPAVAGSWTATIRASNPWSAKTSGPLAFTVTG